MTQVLLTNREQEAIIFRKSKTLHRPSVVGDGALTSSILDVPNTDEALVTVATTSC